MISSSPATAALADKAGTGPEGHKRTPSVESDATLVGDDQPELDAHTKAAVVNETLPPPPRVLKRAASVSDLGAQATKRGRVTTEAASGAPVHTTPTKNEEGLPTAAAPITESFVTAAALAAADYHTDEPVKSDEASKTDDCEDTTHLASAAAQANESTAPAQPGPESFAIALAPPSPSLSDAGAVVADIVPEFNVTFGVPDDTALLFIWCGLEDVVLPPQPITSAAVALNAITGGHQPTTPINWAAVAASAPQSAVPPASSTALHHLGPAAAQVLPPLPPVVAGHIHLASMVPRGRAQSPDRDVVAEHQLGVEMDDFENKVTVLLAGTSRQGNGAASTSRESAEEADQAVLDDAVQEANEADLELYRDQQQADSWGVDEDAHNPDWL